MSYYPGIISSYTDSSSEYGVPITTEFRVDPGSFLESYLREGLKEDAPLGDPAQQKLFEEMMYEENPIPGFSVDPNQLDLREYRVPGAPAHPGEFLERDRFLRSVGSPLT